MTDTKFLIYLGDRIKVLRSGKQISQNELAALCNIDKGNMSRIESGKSNITILTLKKLSDALDVDIAEFLKKK